MPFDLRPILKSTLLELRPLQVEDFDNLYGVASDPLVWKQHPVKNRYEKELFKKFFTEALDSGGTLITMDLKTNQVIGSSRYHGYDEQKSEIEIGWSLLARSKWGGTLNREMKHLMLQHAFRFVNRVLFLVGSENFRSKRAVEKIGGLHVGSSLDSGGHDSFIYQITASTFTPILKNNTDPQEH